MLRIERITDIIAADEWRHGGKVSRIENGRPQPAPDDPNGDWCCPVFIQGFSDGIVPAYGVGPVDALMNAVLFGRSFADQMGEFAPRALDYPDETTA